MALLITPSGDAARADTISYGVSGDGSRIVNGDDTHDYPTTGQLLNGGGSWCSGTLIGCQTFLTAAHCVEGNSNPSAYSVYLQHAGVIGVSAIASHPSYSFPIADVAVLTLSTPVTGIEPTPVNTTDPTPFIPKQGVIAGFGRTGGSADDYGIKRVGLVETSNCQQGADGGSNTELVCWDYTNPIGPQGQDSNTCNGDSGGPLFMEFGSGLVVAGITSGGNNGTCLATDDSYDVNVATYSSYILGVLGSDSTSVCGGLPAVGVGQATVVGNSGNLSGGNSSDSFTVNVASGTNELRFAMNGEDNGSLGLDLYVKAGSSVSTGNFDCKADGNSNFGDCTFSNPTPGTWSVLVNRTGGSGQYQVTTTLFGGDPPVCGNDSAESGEECDGSDDGACPGQCGVDCMCPPPVCGNDVIEAGETCDGADPGSCPTSTCDIDCTCPAPICGNDTVESGEQCDGNDDDACPGQCDSCSCPATCLSELVFNAKLKSNSKKVKFKGLLDDFYSEFTGLDPRDGFALVLSQGGDSVTLSIPSGDSGWGGSKPGREKYLWSGNIGGFTRVKLIYKSGGFFPGFKMNVTGKNVAGGADLDGKQEFTIRTTLDGVCNETSSDVGFF